MAGAMVLLLMAPFAASPPAGAQAPSTISISDATQPFEGDGGSSVIAFTVSLSAPSNQQTIVNFSTGDDPSAANRATAGSGGCSAGEDYLALTSAITIPANTSAPPSADILITTCGDTLDEFDETFVVTIFSPTPALQITDNQARGTILDDDAPPQVSISRSSTQPFFEGNAGTSNFGFTVSLSTASGKTVTVQPTTASGTASGGAAYGGAVDFVNAPLPLLTFQPGERTRTVNVPVCGDLLAENNETFTASLTNPTNATLGTSSATATITDDDTPPAITINNIDTVEGNITLIPFRIVKSHTAFFTVSLSRAFGQAITVEYSSASGTASTGSSCFSFPLPDFQLTGTRTLTIPAYQTTAAIGVEICHDGTAEPDETFFVNLQNPSAGTLADSQGRGTIVNDDTGAGTFVLTPANATVSPQDGVTYTLEWTVPAPLTWHDLRSLDLRLRDEREMAIWLRWDEASNSFRLVNPAGNTYGPSRRPGEAAVLAGRLARLDLEETQVVGGGPTSPQVTLTLDLKLDSRARGRTFVVEVAGLDDAGHQDALTPAGTLTVW